MPIFAVVLFAALMSLKTFGIDSEKTNSLSSDRDVSWPDRRQLLEKMWEVRKIVMVYADSDTGAAVIYRAHFEKLARRFEKFEVAVKPEGDVTQAELSTLPVILVGRNFSNTAVNEVLSRLPIKVKRSEFEIPGFFKSNPEDIFTLPNYPNPCNRELPISVVSGNTERDIADFLQSANRYLLRAGEFRVFRARRGIVLGFFKQNQAGAPWDVDSAKSRNYLQSEMKEYESEHYSFQVVGSGAQGAELKTMAKLQEARLDALVAALAVPADEVAQLQIQYFVYESLEDKGLLTGNTDLSHFDSPRREIHAILNDDLNGTDFFADARLLTSLWLGEVQSPALRDGLAIYFSEDWGRHGYEFWAKKFHEAGAFTLPELLDPEIYAHESYLFVRPLAGSFVKFLIAEFGTERFLELYRVWPASGLPAAVGFDLETLEAKWRTYWRKQSAGSSVSVQAGVRRQHPVFQKGFCYAHEGYQIHNGYLSRKSDESLDRLRSLGTEWISVTPFGYMKERNKPSWLTYSSGAGAENDESVLSTFYSAKKLGLDVMLKPHVLMHSWNFGWPGEIEMKTKADWQLFFKYYQSWIRHYAILAEMHNMDLFCVGVEFLKATGPEHSDEWRAIIRSIRQIYSGPLVYAANWWQEFDQIEFWDELDYLGLNCYYPLHQGDDATLEELKAGVEKLLPDLEAAAKKYGKPVLLTEVGFTSTAASWKNPHERKRGATVQLDDQVIAYRAVFESFWDKSWFAGFYWWKWPTYLEYGGSDHSGFTPNGKPAEQVVAEWYGREAPGRNFSQ